MSEDPEYLANKELARRVVANNKSAVNYYLGPFCESLVWRLNFLVGQDVYADLFLFLAHPFEECSGRPGWHRVSLYDGRDCTLKSYTARICCRHFYKQVTKGRLRKNSEEELLEFRDYESLLSCDSPENDGESADKQCMRLAFNALKERDKRVLHCLVIEKMSGIDAYEQLEQFVHPQEKNGLTSEEVKARWTLKQKQDVVSLMKGRALKHLLEKYQELKHRY
jgi:hypothetical protein